MENIEGHNASTNETNAKQSDEVPKITSVVKTEKIKDPRRVAQGKKLAAISREAKQRKAKEREAAIRKEEVDKCDRREENSFNASYAIISVIGIALDGYYFLYLRNSKKVENRLKEGEEPKKPNLEKL